MDPTRPPPDDAGTSLLRDYIRAHLGDPDLSADRAVIACGMVLTLFEGSEAYGLASRFERATGESVAGTIARRQPSGARQVRFLGELLDPIDDPLPDEDVPPRDLDPYYDATGKRRR